MSDIRWRMRPTAAAASPLRQGGALLWIYSLVALLISALVTFVVSFLVASRADALDGEARNLARWASMVSESTQRLVFDTDLLAAALEEELLRAGWRTREEFRRVAAGRPIFEWMRGAVMMASDTDALTLVGSDGMLLNTSRSYPVPPLNLSDREYFALLRDRPDVPFLVVGPVKNRVTSLDSLCLIRRLGRAGDETIGLINANIHTTRFRRLIEQTLADQPVNAWLLHRDGRPLLQHPEGVASGALGEKALHFMRETLARADGGTLVLSDADGGATPQLLAIQEMRGYPLVIAITKSQSDALATWRRQAQLLALLTAGAVLLVIGIGWMLARQWRLRALAVESEQLRSLNAQLGARVQERERAEQALRQLNDELEARVDQRTRELRVALVDAERASRAKSDFLSAMSHELRTPLNAVLGFAQLLEVDKAPRLSERQLDFVGHIHSSGKHLLDLINEVLDLARVEAGMLTISREPVALAPLIDECVALVKPLADARRLTLEVDATAPDCQVQADRTRARQVLLNLLSNAVKYNRVQGTVRVLVEQAGRRARVSVEDTGPGLSAAQQERLFVPFERLGTDGSSAEGTGIGLALSKRLMELMRGSIGVHSTEGVGSRFWVEWPVASARAKATEPVRTAGEQDEAGSAVVARSCRVLCIEDNPLNLQLIRHVIARHREIELISAEHPARGLELAGQLLPHLILLDINLPEMDGYAVFARLRADAATRTTPVIAISAHAMPADVARGRAAGFAAYLTKPLDLAQFERVLDEQLRQRRHTEAPEDDELQA